MIKRPFALVQILAVAFVLSKVIQDTQLFADYQTSITIGIALLSVGWAWLSGVVWDRLNKKNQN